MAILADVCGYTAANQTLWAAIDPLNAVAAAAADAVAVVAEIPVFCFGHSKSNPDFHSENTDENYDSG